MVTGRTPNRAEKSLFAYMMGGPIPGFFRGRPRQSKKPVLWTCDGEAERLTADSPEKAVEDYLDECFLVNGRFPETVTLYGYARQQVPLRHVDCLDDALEWLDENYSGPDCDPTKPTPKMREAHEAFRRVVIQEYTPWSHEEVCRKTVNVREWCQEHAPHWLPENTKGGE